MPIPTPKNNRLAWFLYSTSCSRKTGVPTHLVFVRMRTVLLPIISLASSSHLMLFFGRASGYTLVAAKTTVTREKEIFMCFRPPTADAGPVSCPQCGASVDPFATTCPQCGASAQPNAPQRPGVPQAPGAPQAPGVPRPPAGPKPPQPPSVHS